VQTQAVVQLRHRQLVFVGEQDAFGGGVIEWVHNLSIRREAADVKRHAEKANTAVSTNF
jgi:hypothetical protein